MWCVAMPRELVREARRERRKRTENMDLIPFPYQSDLTIYGKDVMDFTVLGLRSM